MAEAVTPRPFPSSVCGLLGAHFPATAGRGRIGIARSISGLHFEGVGAVGQTSVRSRRHTGADGAVELALEGRVWLRGGEGECSVTTLAVPRGFGDDCGVGRCSVRRWCGRSERPGLSLVVRSVRVLIE